MLYEIYFIKHYDPTIINSIIKLAHGSSTQSRRKVICKHCALTQST